MTCGRDHPSYVPVSILIDLINRATCLIVISRIRGMKVGHSVIWIRFESARKYNPREVTVRSLKIGISEPTCRNTSMKIRFKGKQLLL